MKLPLSLLLFSLALGACRTTISGRITTPQGKQVSASHGKVNITRLDERGFSEIIPLSNNGHFISEGEIQPGEYLIEPLIPGYQSNSVKVIIKDDHQLELHAIPLPKNQTKAIEAHSKLQMDQGSGGAIINPPRL